MRSPRAASGCDCGREISKSCIARPTPVSAEERREAGWNRSACPPPSSIDPGLPRNSAWEVRSFLPLAPSRFAKNFIRLRSALPIHGRTSVAKGAFVTPIFRIPFAAATLIFFSLIGVFLYSGDGGSTAGEYLEFTLDYNSTEAVEENILRDLASRPSLVSQRALVTIPVLSTEAPVRELSRLAGYNLKSYLPKLSLNLQVLPGSRPAPVRYCGFWRPDPLRSQYLRLLGGGDQSVYRAIESHL